ncbi:LPS-assembly protein LptD [Zavarzinella formosa]|uniref:hypothetical protein n=1 Tax=Zavarzinella formosa TaxID=360055 RepID=UPI0003013B58|nr:hypothetical protein [Zavarzinella formosa]
MGGRSTYLWLALAFLTLGAGMPTVAVGAEITRLQWTAPAKTPFSMMAKDIFTWQDGMETAFLLRGAVVLDHDGNSIRADEAIVWWDSIAKNRREPIKVVVFAKAADGQSVLINHSGGSVDKQPAVVIEAAMVEFTTPAIGRYGYQVTQKSMASDALFKEASLARGRTVQAAKPAEDPAAKTLVLPVQAIKRDAEPPPMPAPGGVQPKNTLPPPAALDPPLITGTTVIPVPLSETRTIWIAPRSTQPYEVRMTLIDKERVTVVTGGIKLLAKFTTGQIRALQVEADRIVIWRKGGDSKSAVDAMGSTDGSDSAGLEFYMSGNVVIRYGGDDDGTATGKPATQSKTLRAERVYYDVERHKAIAIEADLEYIKDGYANKAHMKGREIYQLGSSEFQAILAEIHASRLPSDPELRVTTPMASIYKMPRELKTTIIGTPFRDRLTGELIEEDPEILEATDVTTKIGPIPVFYAPKVKTDLEDPLGPFKGVVFRQDRIFGFQTYLTWDMLDLIGLKKLPGEKWDLLTDYLGRRGPGLGTRYLLSGDTFLGMDAPFQTLVKGYIIHDKGTDIIGGERGMDFSPPDLRGRFLWRHQQEFGDLTLQSQIAYLSDRNFYEQYYNFDYNQGPNQETFLWLKYQNGNAAVTMLTEPNIRNWVSETQWLPKLEGQLLGISLFDTLTYHTWGSVGYARSSPYRQPTREFPFGVDVNSPPIEPSVNTGRFDWMQELSMPFYAGPLKVVPYGVADFAYYTSDTANRSPEGRAYGGLGVRSSLPLSRLYSDIESELFNVQGIYHKNVFSANYYYAASSTSHTLLPQLDRLNDDATESSWRDITPWHPYFDPTMNIKGAALASSPIYDPRLYAIRRLVDSKPDTLDDIQVLQLGWRQRFQTKRGYPGLEHEVDWLTINLTGSIFPTPERDNFGKNVGFLESNVVWNVGDRNSVYLDSWVDPYDLGARYVAVGTSYQRDDRTRLSVSYRTIEPVGSRLVTASVGYVFNPKYVVTAATSYEFSTQASLSNSLTFTRIGTDMQVSVGFNYNALLNTFGFNVNVVPNLAAGNNAASGTQASFGGLGGSPTQDRR